MANGDSLPVKPAASGADPWGLNPASYGTTGTFGNLVRTNLDINVGSRLATASYAVAPSAAAVATAVLTSTVPTDLGTAGSLGFAAGLTNTNLDAKVSTRSVYAGADTPGTATLLGRITGPVAPQSGDAFARLGAPTGASIAADLAANPAAVWASGGRTLSSFSFVVTAGTVSDKTGYVLSAAGLDSVTVEPGVNARQALSPILAAAAGNVSEPAVGAGANVNTTIRAPVPGGLARITATESADGTTRTVTISPPP
jgi:hypothetical protein